MLAQLRSATGPNFHPPDYHTFKAPPPQQTMPDVNAPPAPLFTEPFSTDDTGNHPYPPQVTVGGSGMLVPLGFTGYSIVQILLALYGNLLLFALYAAWLAVAFVELSQREDLSAGRRLGWGAVTLAVPILGPIAYYFAGGSKLSRGFRLALVVGAPLLCLVLTVLLVVIASFTL
jgi:Phospholipase_D-nuclease N-terminal